MTLSAPPNVQVHRLPKAVRCNEGLGRRFVLSRLPWSLPGGRLPKFYLVSFWIDDPGKFSVLGIVDLLENVAAFFP
jgi:hypothetical protein